MSNSSFFMWVKNVHNMRTLDGIGCGTTSPLHFNTPTYPQLTSEKVTTSSQLIVGLHTSISTAFLSKLHLLINELYLLSTRPTITKANKKIK